MKLLLHPVFLTLLVCTCMACSQSGSGPGSDRAFPALSGPYLGQPSPGSVPGVFALGVISTGMLTRDMAIRPDGKEIFYCISIGNYTFSTILFTRELEGKWMPPEIVPFSGGPGVLDFEPAFSADGNRLYFLSNRPDGDEPAGDQDIWYVERTPEGWSEPVNLGLPVNTDGGEFFPSLTRDGTLYFTRNAKGSRVNQLFRSRFVNGAFQEPELLPEQVNCGTDRFNAFVSPDETYLIIPVAGMEDSFDGVDYYIVFRDSADHWSNPVNMGPHINSDNPKGWSPYVSPDGKYFFFMATRTSSFEPEDWNYRNLVELHNSPGNGNASIYWVETGFFSTLREQAWFPPHVHG